MDLTLLKEGLIIMVIGMGTVFIFLTIMIYAMNISSVVLKFVSKYFPEEVLVEKKPTKKSTTSDDEDIALAIACAIHKASKA